MNKRDIEEEHLTPMGENSTKSSNREDATLIIPDELQDEENYLSSMSGNNIEGQVMSYEAPIAVSVSKDEIRQSCNEDNDKEDSDISLTVPMDNIDSKSETQQFQVIDSIIPPLDFDENATPKKSNNLEVTSLIMTSELTTDTTEDRLNYTIRKMNAREVRPVINDEPNESDINEVHNPLKDDIDESFAPKDDSEGDEDRISEPISEATSIPENDYTEVVLLDDEHEIAKMKNDESSAIDRNLLVDKCVKVSNEFKNEEVHRSSRKGKTDRGVSMDDNHEEAMSKSYTAHRDTSPKSGNRNVEYCHQEQNMETEIKLRNSKYILKEKCQIHTNVTLGEMHNALEEKNENHGGDICSEEKSKEKVDDLGTKGSIDAKDNNCADHGGYENMDLKGEIKNKRERSRLDHGLALMIKILYRLKVKIILKFTSR